MSPIEWHPHGMLLSADGGFANDGAFHRVLSVPDLSEARRLDLGGAHPWGHLPDGRLVTWTEGAGAGEPFAIRASPLDGGPAQMLGTSARWWEDIDDVGRHLVSGRGRSLVLSRLGTAPERVLGRLAADVVGAMFLPGEDRLVSADAKGEVRVWSAQRGFWRVLAAPTGSSRLLLGVARNGSRLAVNGPNASVDVWDFSDPPEVEPLRLLRPEPLQGLTTVFAANGSWLVTDNEFALSFWPLNQPRMRTLRRQGALTMSSLAFSPDGRWLASCNLESAGVRLWPVRPADATMRPLRSSGGCCAMRFHPGRGQLLVGTIRGDVRLLSLQAPANVRRLVTEWEGEVANGTCAVDFDASGRRAAASPFDMGPSIRDPRHRVLRVFDLASGRGRTYSLAHLTDASWWGFDRLRFAADGSVIAGGAGAGGVSRLVLPEEAAGAVSREVLFAAGASGFDLSADGRQLVVWASRTPAAEHMEELLTLDLSGHSRRHVTTHGRRTWSAAIAPSGRAIVTGDVDGVVRVGPITGEEPHLLVGGHSGVVWSVAVSPDERWVASVGDDAIRLWPMPNLSEPPLHTLPRRELLARLDALSNVRAVADTASFSGWKTEIGPFPGWKDLQETR